MSEVARNVLNLPSRCSEELAEGFAKGRLVAVCGIDGSGKSTLIATLAERFRSRGLDVETTRQPTDFYRQNAAVRAYHDTGQQVMWPEGIALLSAVDRMLHLRQEVLPALNRGAIVLCDRYVVAAFAIFSARGIPISWIESINSYVPPAHLTLLLDLPADVAIDRINKRGGYIRLEERSSEFLEKVRKQYLLHAADALVLDAQLSSDEVANQAEAAIMTTFSSAEAGF